MAAHPRTAPCSRSGSPAGRPKPGTKLLIATQWVLTVFGIFCLIGVAVMMALKPDEWPM